LSLLIDFRKSFSLNGFNSSGYAGFTAQNSAKLSKKVFVRCLKCDRVLKSLTVSLSPLSRSKWEKTKDYGFSTSCLSLDVSFRMSALFASVVDFDLITFWSSLIPFGLVCDFCAK